MVWPSWCIDDRPVSAPTETGRDSWAMRFWLLCLKTLLDGAMSVGYHGSSGSPASAAPGSRAQHPGELRVRLWSAGSAFLVQSPWTSAKMLFARQQAPRLRHQLPALRTRSVPVRDGGRRQKGSKVEGVVRYCLLLGLISGGRSRKLLPDDFINFHFDFSDQRPVTRSHNMFCIQLRCVSINSSSR